MYVKTIFITSSSKLQSQDLAKDILEYFLVQICQFDYICTRCITKFCTWWGILAVGITITVYPSTTYYSTDNTMRVKCDGKLGTQRRRFFFLLFGHGTFARCCKRRWLIAGNTWTYLSSEEISLLHTYSLLQYMCGQDSKHNWLMFLENLCPFEEGR